MNNKFAAKLEGITDFAEFQSLLQSCNFATLNKANQINLERKMETLQEKQYKALEESATCIKQKLDPIEGKRKFIKKWKKINKKIVQLEELKNLMQEAEVEVSLHRN